MYTQYILQIPPLEELLCFASAEPTIATCSSTYLNFNRLVLELNVLCELYKTRTDIRAAQKGHEMPSLYFDAGHFEHLTV
jgi:hypothetical protein